MRHPLSNQSGLTLVEVVAAIAILGLALIPIAGLFSSGTKGALAADCLATGTLLAQNKIEALRAGAFSAVVSQSLAPVPDYPGYQMQVVVEAIGLRLKQVTVTVSWDLADSQSQVVLVTYVGAK